MSSDPSGEAAPARYDGPRNFYCHQCHSRTHVSAEEFSCSSCGSGFIEEISLDDDDDDHWEQGGAPAAGGENSILEQLFAQAILPGAGGGGNPFIGGSRRSNASPPAVGDSRVLLGDQFFQSLISNLTGVPIGGGHPLHFALGPMGVGNVMYGNPGDYAWGRGGFDAVVTQLLNQMEGTGPPPMAKDKINMVQETKVTKEHIDQNLQCSVCWDDFKLEEKVRRLNCDHIFHPDCIVPWLELHATCPVCRKPLTEDAKACQEAADREYNGYAAGGGGGPSEQNDQSGAGNAHRTAAAAAASSTTNPQGQQQQQQRASNNLGSTISLVFNHLFGQGGGEQPAPRAAETSSSSEGSSTSTDSSTSSSQSERSAAAVSASRDQQENAQSSDLNRGRQGFQDFDLE